MVVCSFDCFLYERSYLATELHLHPFQGCMSLFDRPFGSSLRGPALMKALVPRIQRKIQAPLEFIGHRLPRQLAERRMKWFLMAVRQVSIDLDQLLSPCIG